MAVFKNRTQNDFTIVSNVYLRDREVSMKDRGLIITLCSFPDNWNFSIAGLAAIVPDGKDSLRSSMTHLEKLGYIRRSRERDPSGKFCSTVELYASRPTVTAEDMPRGEIHDGLSAAAYPPRKTRDGTTVTDNPVQSNKHINTSNLISISIDQSNDEGDMSGAGPEQDDDGRTDEEILSQRYRDLIAGNIRLSELQDAARRRSSMGDEAELEMVNEIYGVICAAVCKPRSEYRINGGIYPGFVVQSQFMKLTYEDVAAVINRLLDGGRDIQNMEGYLISSLFNQSITGVTSTLAQYYDKDLNELCGDPY